MYFGSDNQTGASDKVLQAVIAVNQGYHPAYAGDKITAQAVAAIQTVFDYDCDVFFVSTGTAANCLALSSMVQPWQVVICHDSAHILNDESTAPEFFTAGARIVGTGEQDVKLTPDAVHQCIQRYGHHYPHNPDLGVISVSQASEWGLVYNLEELSNLSAFAKDKGMTLHMDGARFANALVALGCSPAEMTWKAGVDVLCLGATKNGCLGAEIVIFFNKTLSQGFDYRRKRTGHLLSKNRFMAAQTLAWLDQQHWLDLAKHANDRARQLADALVTFPHIELAHPVEANELFVLMPEGFASSLQDAGAVFSSWNMTALPQSVKRQSNHALYRLVTSFATQAQDVEAFINMARLHS